MILRVWGESTCSRMTAAIVRSCAVVVVGGGGGANIDDADGADIDRR